MKITILFIDKHIDLLSLLNYNKWMNCVVYDTITFHGFYSRLSVNVEEIDTHFGHGLKSLEKIEKTRKFIILNEYPICEYCERNQINTVVYYSVGYKMKSSSPYLYFGCKSCIKTQCVMYGDCYQDPVITIYNMNYHFNDFNTKNENKTHLCWLNADEYYLFEYNNIINQF